ncbi:MAG: NADH-quinone oxidoreductase subunit M [Candidatus Thalassarchaeaceae archaeon]|jgi:NADH-quinone oxidoreductase subunit M|nr:NADH-quinone oxidoreductase subunit M [Candidatus Thalassarchaeaceae archaeon]
MGGGKLILTILTLGPIAVGLLLLLLPLLLHPFDEQIRRLSRSICLGVALGLFAVSTYAATSSISDIDWTGIRFGNYEFENTPFALIPYIGVSWHVGVDALSFPMVWLTSMIIPVSMLVEWDAKNGHNFHPLLLIMEGAMMGVFVALDLFVFYVFWELTLIPMFFLILMWGGEDRRYAAMKFFIYTFTASVVMLIGILVMYFHTTDPGTTTGHTFDLVAMLADDNLIVSEGLRHLVWLLLLIGFATKMPSVPVHTWLPDAHVQAPTAGSMILAGVMLKMGAYGFLRVAVTAFPGSTVVFTPLLLALGMASLVYGAWVCMGQTNLKRMVAYSSVSHMGLIFLGIATMQPLGIAGALFMMFAHGIISPLLFAVAGAFKHHYHTLEIGSMRGIAHHSPWLSGHMMIGWMASLGLPLLAGFVAEVAVLIAFWMTFGWLVLLPALTLIITAAYYLTSMQRTIFESDDPHHGILPDTLHDESPRDITWHENAGMLILGAFTALFGILPFFFWDMMSDWSNDIVLSKLVEAMSSEGVKP